MSEALKALVNIRTLRAQAREVELAMLEELLEKVRTVVEERRDDEESMRRVTEEKQAKLESFRQRLLDEGIDPSELLSIPKSPKEAKVIRAPRPARYKYIDSDGSEKTWTGQGRTPKAIAEAIARGKELSDFEI